MGIRTSIDLKLDLSSAFNALVGELSTALSELGMQFEAGVHGRVMEGSTEVGRVIGWQPGEQILLEWHGADWLPAEVATVELRFEPIEGGTRVTLQHPEWGSVLGDQGMNLRAGLPARLRPLCFAPWPQGAWAIGSPIAGPGARQGRRRVPSIATLSTTALTSRQF